MTVKVAGRPNEGPIRNPLTDNFLLKREIDPIIFG